MPPNIQVETLADQLNRMQQRVTRLENSPQLGNVSIEAGALQILDGTGRLVMSLGYQPDGTIGLGLYDPASGARRILLGQVAGQEVLEFLDSSSRLAMSLGYQPDGLIGLANYEPASGTRETMMGQINISPVQYGLTVLQGNAMQLVAGAVSAYAAGPFTFGGTPPSPPLAFVDIGGPGVTVTVGPSGSALCTIFALTQLGADRTLLASVGVDGSLTPPTSSPFIENLSTSGNGLTLSASGSIWGLAAGSHTIKMLFSCDGGSASFSGCALVVVPL